MLTKLYLWLLCVTLSHVALAQLEVQSTSSDIKQLSDIYNLEIANPSLSQLNVYLEIDLRQNSQIIYEATTNQVQLLQSITPLNIALLQPIQVRRNTVENLAGTYQLNVRIVDVSTQQIVTANRFNLISISSEESAQQSRTNQVGKAIDFQQAGEATISGQLSDMQGVGSFVPQNYLRAELYQDVSIAGIPIGVDALYSTEQNAFRQSMNQVALRFDAQQFKRTMQQRLQSKIREVDAIGDLADVQNLDQLKEKTLAKKFPKLKEWESQLADPQIQEGLAQLKQLESIEAILSSEEIQQAVLSKAKLEAKNQLSTAEAEELERLNSFVSEIEKLQKRADNIRQVAQQYEKYKDLQGKIEQAKKYGNRDILKDPSFLKNGLKSMKLLSKPQEILAGFDAITIGTSYPFYSNLTLSSLSVNGVNIEWNPGKIYLATTYGQSSRLTYNNNFANPVLNLPQLAFATKLGYGSPSSSHIYLTFVNIADRFDERYTDNRIKPQSNRVVGTDAQVSLFSNKVTIGGEVNASLLTRDNTIDTEPNQEFARNDIPLNSLMGNINNSSSFDLAWKAYVDARMFGNNTKVKASIQRIGANYYSLGAPTLLNDILRWKVELKQAFLKNRLSLSAYARQDDNNLEPLLTSSQSTTRSFGISGSAAIPKWPTLTFSFAPYSQNNEIAATNENVETNATMTNLSLSYPTQINKALSSFTQVSFLQQNLQSSFSDIDFNLTMYTLSQSFTYKANGLSFSVNYTPNQIINQENKEVISLNTSANARLFNKLQTSLGYQYLSITDLENRQGFFGNVSYPIASFVDFEARVQRNIYQSNIEFADYNDIVAWGTLKFRW